jgi:exopolyphosphatase / guanosine-5'-triphosphate,3'-diphosphate pyrophosphatase
MNNIRLAVIDIGSNAIRMQISALFHNESGMVLKKMEYLRFPLRLGQEVFSQGFISPTLEAKFMKLMQAFKNMIDLYEVTGLMACATSAMRDSTNGPALVAKVKSELGLEIQIIDGQKEAAFIDKAIAKSVNADENYIHIDVGGGSTEINIYQKGTKLASESFNAGSVRNSLKPLGIFRSMDEWLNEHLPQHMRPIKAIGTGGNIGKIYELHKQRKPKANSVSYADFLELFQMLEELTIEERISKLLLNPDRADVIIPASQIYLHVMRMAHAHKILVPDVGLKDGMMATLVERYGR